MTEKKPIVVKCPSCGADVIWSEVSPNRPFCSEQCKNKDFIAWANEKQRISGDSNYDDVLSDDLENN
ncbi:MAG: hypothetical protein JWM78_1953 [Verrucomicrobiaceae bacterium]|nr:hypothetical protein [Verrucomicrobiaceae bacterium]